MDMLIKKSRKMEIVAYPLQPPINKQITFLLKDL